MEQSISRKNARVLNTVQENETKLCNWPKNRECPLEKKCLSKNIIYQGTATLPSQEAKTYIGLTSTDVQERLANHKQSFRNPEVNQTSLNKYIFESRSKGMESTVTWKIIDRGNTYSPISGV